MTFITSSGGTAFRREPRLTSKCLLVAKPSYERERGVAERGEGFDLAGLDPAMAFLDRFDTPEVRRRRPYRRGGNVAGRPVEYLLSGRVALDGEEVVPAAVDDRLTDRPLGENRVARDGDTFERQRFQRLQRGGDLPIPDSPSAGSRKDRNRYWIAPLPQKRKGQNLSP